MSRAELDLVRAIARLLNEELGVEETLAAVAEALRRGLACAGIAIWLREAGTTAFRAIASPPAPDGPPLAPGIGQVPLAPGWRRFPLEHEGARLGLLDARAADAGMDDGSGSGVLAIAADLLALYLASAELSSDLAGEVAVQSREIEEHRRFTSLIVDSLPLGLYVVDREYRIQSWNRKRETGTQGLRRDDVVGRPVFEVLTRQPPEQLRAEFDRVFATGEIQQTEQEVHLGTETRRFRLSRIPMRLEGDRITHVITVGEDVTEWHRVQTRIAQNEKLAAVGQLAAGVMHEINNPLATISACVAAVEGHLPPAARQDAAIAEYLQTIDREVGRCSGIVDRLLDFSRPKPATKSPVSLNHLVEEALFLLKHHRKFKRLDVVCTLAPGLPRTLGDREQLIQVLMALMLNALDAMENGGRLTVRTGSASSGEVVVEVSDTGAGIPRAEQRKIFEPFYTTKAPGRGTGLGLSICHSIVADHRGWIEVDSDPGRGATFRVLLPAAA